MKGHKKDSNYEEEFEGSKDDLEKYYERVYLETIDNWFGALDKLKIGEQMDDVICTKIIKRKSDKIYIMFSMTVEAMIKERNFKPLQRIDAENEQ
jgi:hypothetical protein